LENRQAPLLFKMSVIFKSLPLSEDDVYDLQIQFSHPHYFFPMSVLPPSSVSQVTVISIFPILRTFVNPIRFHCFALQFPFTLFPRKALLQAFHPGVSIRIGNGGPFPSSAPFLQFDGVRFENFLTPFPAILSRPALHFLLVRPALSEIYVPL